MADSSTSGCPICLNDMAPSDVHYPLVCPTPGCDYNMCLDCILGMKESEADGYQQASDGSNQVKYSMACPACRVKYNPLALMSTSTSSCSPTNNNAADNGKKPDIDQSVIDHVILLRRVYCVQQLLGVNDSELSATDLKLKHEFLVPDDENDCVPTTHDVKDAALLLKKYFKDVKKENYLPIFELDWDKLQTVMSSTSSCKPKIGKKSTPSATPKGSKGSSTDKKKEPWRDVTLFYGVLEDIMTVSEQEFLTQLFTSGQPDLVAQAAHIVHGILSMSSQRQAQAAVESLSSFKNGNSSRPAATTTTNRAPSMSPKKLAQLRGRFPLPKRMPLCVSLPVYEPHPPKGSKEQPLLQFADPPKPSRWGSSNNTEKQQQSDYQDHEDLVLARVRGPAGRLGLRRGDVVTHVQGGCETVVNRAQFHEHLQLLLGNVSTPTAAAAAANASDSGATNVTLLVVNADQETATALRDRAIKMRKELP